MKERKVIIMKRSRSSLTMISRQSSQALLNIGNNNNNRRGEDYYDEDDVEVEEYEKTRQEKDPLFHDL